MKNEKWKMKNEKWNVEKNDLSMCVAWRIHVCDMTPENMRHDSFTCAIWHIKVCDMTCVTWLVHRETLGASRHLRNPCVSHHDSFTGAISHTLKRVTWLVHSAGPRRVTSLKESMCLTYERHVFYFHMRDTGCHCEVVCLTYENRCLVSHLVSHIWKQCVLRLCQCVLQLKTVCVAGPHDDFTCTVYETDTMWDTRLVSLCSDTS